MRSLSLIIGVFFNVIVNAQTYSYRFVTGDVSSDHSSFLLPELFRNGDEILTIEGERIGLSEFNFFTPTSPPLLTTNAADLEICTGNSTRLTASSNHQIYWYTTPPPIGTPVGTGTSYITPVLTTGYYTYYAVAEHEGIKSEVTAMEVVMVYPNPNVSITSSADKICPNQSVTLTATGTTYYQWENGPVSSQLIIQPGNTQTYKVTGVNTAGCRSTAEFTQLVDACAIKEMQEAEPPAEFLKNYKPESIKESASAGPVKESRLFSVFPNPNNGEFNIRVNSISESSRIEIYSWLGELNYSTRVTSELMSVTLKDYPNGIYIVRITENDKVLRQQKVVKE